MREYDFDQWGYLVFQESILLPTRFDFREL